MYVRKNLIIAIIWVFALSVLVMAQGQSPRKGPPGFGPPMGGPDQGPGRQFPPDHALSILSSEMRFDGKVVKGAPYSATAITESVQTLSNGARITHKTTASIYRDSEGRTRREMTLDRIGPFATADEPTQLIFINDPVAGVHYMLDQRSHTAGKMGNDRPIEIVSERWDSPELQTVVLSKHNDPRFGETVYRLTNINRAEPAQTLFEVPADYKVEEGQPGGFLGGRPMKRPGDR